MVAGVNAGLRAGVGRRDITPPVGIPACGWGNQFHEVSEGNDLELWSTVLVLEDADGRRAAIADIDLCLLDDHQAEQGRHRIAAAAGIVPERVAVGTTHSHAAPVTGGITGSWIRTGRELVAPYVERVVDSLEGATLEALAALRPVRVGSARGTSPLAVNRRMLKPDGKAAVGLNWEGPVDHTLTAVRLDGEDDSPVATLVHYAAHPIILGPDNRFVTPEYPGILKRVVEASLGGRCLFVQGACGDVGPREIFVDDLAVYRRLGAVIGHAAASVAWRASWRSHRQLLRESERSAWIAMFDYVDDTDPDATLAVAGGVLELPLRDDLGDPDEWSRSAASLEDELYAARGGGASEGEIRELTVRTKFATMRAERGEALRGRSSYTLGVQGVRLGPVALVGVPVELFSQTGRAIRDDSPFATTLVASYWNGYRNYLPTDDERPRGGYEIDISPYRAGSDALVRAAAASTLAALAGA